MCQHLQLHPRAYAGVFHGLRQRRANSAHFAHRPLPPILTQGAVFLNSLIHSQTKAFAKQPLREQSGPTLSTGVKITLQEPSAAEV